MGCWEEGISGPNFLLGSELGSQVLQSRLQQSESTQVH